MRWLYELSLRLRSPFMDVANFPGEPRATVCGAALEARDLIHSLGVQPGDRFYQ